MSVNVVCQYCGKLAEFVDSREIYGKSYGMIYLCRKCNAYVGVHKNTKTPLGILANAELREWKKRAHFYFDWIWKSKTLTRDDAYKWLSEKMNKNRANTHIGMFDVDDCKKVIKLSKGFWDDIDG